jgi:hypothetical protein
VENDRWLLRACSSGRSEVISPRGVPSEEGIDVGKVGHAVLPFAHRDSWTPAYWLSFLGPEAALGTLVFSSGAGSPTKVFAPYRDPGGHRDDEIQDSSARCLKHSCSSQGYFSAILSKINPLSAAWHFF